MTVRCSGQLDDGTKIDEYDSLELCLGEDDFIPGTFLHFSVHTVYLKLVVML